MEHSYDITHIEIYVSQADIFDMNKYYIPHIINSCMYFAMLSASAESLKWHT